MQPVAIVTDSSACLTPQLAALYGIEVVPTEMLFEGRVYRDGVDEPADFYAQLRVAKRLPTTSAPSPARFLEAYKVAAQRGQSLLCLTLHSNFSALHSASLQAIELAKSDLPGVRIVSLSCPAVAAGQGLLAIEAAELAKQGKSLDELVAAVHQLGPKIILFAMVDTLEYLARGGRVPRAAALLGDFINLKPILTANEGKVYRLTLARSKEHAIGKMLRLMEQRNPKKVPIRVLVMHADAEQEASKFQAQLAGRFPWELLEQTQFTPVMGAHSGPGVVGVAFRLVE